MSTARRRITPSSEVTQPMVEETRPPVVTDHRPIHDDTIITVVSEYFGVTADELCGPSRTRHINIARQIGMYLCRELTEFSHPWIGVVFGGRDHSTVMHAIRKISKEVEEGGRIREQVRELTDLIKQRPPVAVMRDAGPGRDGPRRLKSGWTR